MCKLITNHDYKKKKKNYNQFMILQKSFEYSDLLLKKQLFFINVKTVLLLIIFVETLMHFVFQDYLLNRKFKRTAFI